MFTDAQINDIAVAIGMTPTLLDAHLSSLGTDLTADKETKVLAQLDRYEQGTAGGVVSFTPTESNEGFNLSAPVSAATRNPLTIIRTLLEIPADYWPAGGYGTIRVGV